MYHIRYKGTHYEMGFNRETRLRKHNHMILENVPFKIDTERIEFAKSCIPDDEAD